MKRNVNILTLLKEDQEQKLLTDWLNLKKIRFYAIPNGGSRNLLEAIKLKRTGVKPGVPDLCLPFPSGDWHGMYIEMKRKEGGRISQQQQDWLDYLFANGYYVGVAYGFEMAKEMVEYYLSLNKTAA